MTIAIPEKSGNSDGGSGNVNSEPPYNKKFRINRKTVGLTYSCPKDLECNPVNPEIIKSKIIGYGKVDFLISTEKHKSGKLHFHCYCQYDKALDLKSDKCFDINGVHPKIEKLKKIENWCDYIMKDNDYITNIDEDLIPTKFSIDIELYDWQIDIVNIIKSKPDDRYIYNVIGTEGAEGKTTFQKWLFLNFKGVVVLSGKGADMKNGIMEYYKANGNVPKIVLINVPRSCGEYISWAGVEEIKDMFFFSGKYEGGMICDKNPHLLIFSNEILDDGVKMSKDRWKYINISNNVNNPLLNDKKDEFLDPFGDAV